MHTTACQSECVFRCPPLAYLLVPLRVRHSPLLTGPPFLLASLPIYRRIQPRLPLKATPENLVPRKLISYMKRHMHIESKVKYLVSRR